MLWTLAFLGLTIGLQQTTEFQRYDGWYNNLANPDWGTAGSRLHRDSPSNYDDGIYLVNESLPSARTISDLVFKGSSGKPNRRNMTTMLAFFSQVVAYEIMASTSNGCPLEILKIPVPKCDQVFDPECQGKMEIPFTRAKYDKQTGTGPTSPRQQINDKTSWIDASFVYSTQEPWVASLRSFKNGRLLEGDKGYPPKNNQHLPLENPPPPQIHRLMNPGRLYNSRVNENPALLSFGLIFYRWHNKQAGRIQGEHPDWSDEDVFQAARRWVIAGIQKIIMYDFVPSLLGDPNAIYPYSKYMPHVSPGISHSFAAAAFRFPHSIIPPAMLLRKRRALCEFRLDVGGFPALRLCQNWWNAQEIVGEYSVDEIILGMASQIAEADDNVVVEDLRDFIFGPMHFTRLDVVSSSIMRGRDNGLPSYNSMRRSFGLPPRTWETINPSFYAKNKTLFDNLSALYKGDISSLDAYVGGMLEGVDDDWPGELFRAIIIDQFLRLRDSDRFWFENRLNGLFTDEELAQIRNTTLRDIIVDTTEISENMLQMDVFFWRDGDPCPQPFQVNSTGLEECVPLMRFDYFTGNEAAYIFTLIGLACIPLICLGIGYMLVQRRRAMGWDSGFDSYLSSKGDFNERKGKMRAFEWLEETFVRHVVVEFEPGCLLVKKPGGNIMRKLNFQKNCEVSVSHTQLGSSKMFGPYCLIILPKTYDLVLRLPSDRHLSIFLAKLSESLSTINGNMTTSAETNQQLLDKAETKKRRQSRLDYFFREAYSRAFNVPEMSDASSPTPEEDEVLQETIAHYELAQAMGMRENDLFVKRMFAVCNKREGEELSFADFLAFLKKFTNADPKEKYHLLFAMCDINGNGQVDRKEFAEFLRSLNKVAGVAINDDQQNELVETVLYLSGIHPTSEYLKQDEFEAVFSQIQSRQPIGMDIKGQRIKINVDSDSLSLNSFALPPTSVSLPLNIFSRVAAFLETYRQHIAILFIFICINIFIFIERFWHYHYETENHDHRRVMGVGSAIARGAAGALSFCMALILLTICRNLITLVRDWPIGEYIPFDSAISFHKIVALFILFFSTLHTVGHLVNFYHITTQSQEGLQCLFQETVFGANFIPSISYWFYETITGLTGICLVVVMSIIYVFALPCFIRRAYHVFRLTHLLNYAFYALTILHGLPKLLESPKFLYYVIGPFLIFVIDRIMGMRQEYKSLQIFKASILPSDIIYIKFKRPASFNFRSGQWVRVSSPAFAVQFNEQHAFSIASAPQVPTVELYIKAVGPWTWKLRSEILKAQAMSSPYPLIHLQGPYGDGNQEWRSYDVAVLVGAGIGVTPYASTLTDLVLEIRSGRRHNVKCKKVYFLWVCPSHKNYEWFVDVLREIEGDDGEPLLETHIFITQFFHKYDLRTTMLYICEKHFRGDNAGVSMFTGLRAQNHFGRPNFDTFFKFIQNRHSEVSDVGVFSCGPAAINEQVGAACARANRARDAPYLQHRFETF